MQIDFQPSDGGALTDAKTNSSALDVADGFAKAMIVGGQPASAGISPAVAEGLVGEPLRRVSPEALTLLEMQTAAEWSNQSAEIFSPLEGALVPEEHHNFSDIEKLPNADVSYEQFFDSSEKGDEFTELRVVLDSREGRTSSDISVAAVLPSQSGVIDETRNTSAKKPKEGDQNDLSAPEIEMATANLERSVEGATSQLVEAAKFGAAPGLGDMVAKHDFSARNEGKAAELTVHGEPLNKANSSAEARRTSAEKAEASATVSGLVDAAKVDGAQNPAGQPHPVASHPAALVGQSDNDLSEMTGGSDANVTLPWSANAQGRDRDGVQGEVIRASPPQNTEAILAGSLTTGEYALLRSIPATNRSDMLSMQPVGADPSAIRPGHDDATARHSPEAHDAAFLTDGRATSAYMGALERGHVGWSTGQTKLAETTRGSNQLSQYNGPGTVEPALSEISTEGADQITTGTAKTAPFLDPAGVRILAPSAHNSETDLGLAPSRVDFAARTSEQLGAPALNSVSVENVTASALGNHGQTSDRLLFSQLDPESDITASAVGDAGLSVDAAVRVESPLSMSRPGPVTIAPSNLPTHPMAQVVQMAHMLDQGPVELALNPEELGHVRMSLGQSEGGMVVNIIAERLETYDLLRRNADSLARDLLALGYEQVSFSFQHGRNQQFADQGKTADQTAGLDLGPIVDPGPAAPRLQVTTSSGLDLRL